jgi:hypothetical protein
MAGAIDLDTRFVPADVVKRLRVSVACALLALLGAVALTFLLRRLSGALIEPLSSLGLMTVAAAIVSMVAAYRALVTRIKYSVLSTRYASVPAHHAPSALAFCLVLPSLAALTALASLSIAGTPIVGLVLAWLLLIAAEICLWLAYLGPELRGGGLRPSMIPPTECPAEPDEAEMPDGLVQQVTRTIDADRESIHALLSAQVQAGDRLGVVHIAFCPPLAALPELTAHAIDADDAEVRITQTEMFGARLEVRLPREQASARSLVVELLGSATARRDS